jgi:hypothetical protein
MLAEPVSAQLQGLESKSSRQIEAWARLAMVAAAAVGVSRQQEIRLRVQDH